MNKANKSSFDRIKGAAASYQGSVKEALFRFRNADAAAKEESKKFKDEDGIYQAKRAALISNAQNAIKTAEAAFTGNVAAEVKGLQKELDAHLTTRPTSAFLETARIFRDFNLIGYNTCGRWDMYTVKEVAEILGVSAHTVRYYDDQGLIPGTQRDGANHRMFDDEALEWLFVSLVLSDTGLPLKEVKHYIELYQQGDATIPQRYQIMLEQRKKTQDELEKIKTRLSVLDRKIEHYGKLMDGQEDEWSHEYMQNLIWKGKNK